eukprot:1140767-Pelagomonas_calceolata.AAC.1
MAFCINDGKSFPSNVESWLAIVGSFANSGIQANKIGHCKTSCCTNAVAKAAAHHGGLYHGVPSLKIQAWQASIRDYHALSFTSSPAAVAGPPMHALDPRSIAGKLI